MALALALQRKIWDLREFAKINLPETVGTLQDARGFSADNGIRVLDMPLHIPGQGWRVPALLAQFAECLDLARKSEARFGSLEDLYCYITVDQKPVSAGKTQRRAGAHSDAYIEALGVQVDVVAENRHILAQEYGEVSHTYLCYDALPTEFFMARFPLDDPSCDASLRAFDAIAERSEVITLPTYSVLRLDPYVVHRAAMAKTFTTRTFVKISFSRKRYNRAGNTRNEMFEYAWDMVPRAHVRNHPWG